MKKIVWLASYPKSGNTWFRIFLASYLSETGTIDSLEELLRDGIASSDVDFEEQLHLNPFELHPAEVDNLRPAMYRYLATEANEEVLYKKVHDSYIITENGEPMFPAEASKAALYFVRNPLDVCVSYARHNGISREKQLKYLLKSGAKIGGKRSGQLRQIMGSWKEHYQSWTSQREIPVTVIRYEDMKHRPLEVFRKAVLAMDLPLDEEKLVRAIQNCDFTRIQSMERENGFSERPQVNNQFFWKGQVGSFEGLLSEAQQRQIIDEFYDTMLALGYISTEGQLTLH